MATPLRGHKALQPIIKDVYYPRTSKDVEDLKLFALKSGVNYKDVPSPSYRRTQLTKVTAGARTRGGMSIRGGSV
jgi:hypothetical protein